MQRFYEVASDSMGNVLTSGIATVVNAVTGAVVSSLYASDGSSKQNPFAVPADGVLDFYAPDGIYNIVVKNALGVITGRKLGVQLADFKSFATAASVAALQAAFNAINARTDRVKTFVDAGIGRTSFTVDGDFSGDPNSVAVFINAAYQQRNTYQLIGGSTVQLNTPLANSTDDVEIRYAEVAGAAMAAGIGFYRDTIDDLRNSTSASLPGTEVHIKGYSVAHLNQPFSDTGGGLFRTFGTMAADNACDLIVDASGRRWQRILDDGDLSTRMCGCLTDGVTNDRVAMDRWFARLMQGSVSGRVSHGRHKVLGDTLMWDFGPVRVIGITITGENRNTSIIDVSGVVPTVAGEPQFVFGITGNDGFYINVQGIRVDGRLNNGATLRISKPFDPIAFTYSEAFNSCFMDIGIRNDGTVAPRGVDLGLILDSDLYLVSNCSGDSVVGSEAIRNTGTQFTTIRGGAGNAEFGMTIPDGYVIDCVIQTFDNEVVRVAVQQDSLYASDNKFEGGIIVAFGKQTMGDGRDAVILNAGGALIFDGTTFGLGLNIGGTFRQKVIVRQTRHNFAFSGTSTLDAIDGFNSALTLIQRKNTTPSVLYQRTREANALGGTTNTIVLPNTFSTTDSAYNGLNVGIVFGPGAGYSGVVTGYVGSTRTLTVNPAISVSPTVNSQVELGPATTWEMAVDNSADSGNNVGRNMSFNSYSDAGTLIGNIWNVIRASRVMTIFKLAVSEYFLNAGKTFAQVTAMVSPSDGTQIFCTNGRKIGEGVGVGTGVLVCYSAGQWRRISDDAVLAA